MTKAKKKKQQASPSVPELAYNDFRIGRAARYALVSNATTVKISSEAALINAGVTKEEKGKGERRKRLLSRVTSRKSIMKKESKVQMPKNITVEMTTKNIQKIECSDSIRVQLNEIAKVVATMIRKPTSLFVHISNTNLKQLQFFGCNERDIGEKYAVQFQDFFTKCGFDGSNKGIELLSVKAHILYTATNDYSRQVPHTDFPFTAITEKQNRDGWIGWTVHMPLTTDGS